MKINEIKKNNQVLLERLLDISKGKNVKLIDNRFILFIKCQVKQENIAATLQAPRSLNYILKRREAERIDRENQKIMERIIKQTPSVSSKKLE